MVGQRGFHADYSFHDEYVNWARQTGRANYQPLKFAELNDEGVYVITDVTREARNTWRTKQPTPTVNPDSFKRATARFFRQT